MSETSAAGPPAWVSKRDGRVEPFDADKLCQSLFAAGEALGAANAFLARELTDAVVHFLAADAIAGTIPTSHIAEHVSKVVRELGHPELAQAFARSTGRKAAPPPHPSIAAPGTAVHFSSNQPPEDVVRACLATYSQHAVFTRDLAAAHRDGLIILGGLESPRRLVSVVVNAFDAQGSLDLWRGLAEARAATGGAFVLDGPEWMTATGGPASTGIRGLDWLAMLPGVTDRPAIVNVNSAEPPAWAHRNAGPLFADATTDSDHAIAHLQTLIEKMTREDGRLAWRWHLQGRDFSSAPHAELLRRVTDRALAGAAITFVFDRPRRSLLLADGIDRRCPALLMEVGLDLPVLLNQSAVGRDLRAFLTKLPSLARMAVSAARQKRTYLRAHGDPQALSHGFLIDRAQALMRVIGLEQVTHAMTGHCVGDSPVALELAQTVLRTLNESLTEAGRTAHLAVALTAAQAGNTVVAVDGRSSPAKQHLTTAGRLHAVSGWGTASLGIAKDPAPSSADLVELLTFAWKRTDIVSLQLERTEPASRA